MIAFREPKEPSKMAVSDGGRSIEALKQSVSGTRLSTWQQCRLKFYFRYVAAIPKPVSSALFVGSSVHAVLQAWNLARWRHQMLSEEELNAVFQTLWETTQSTMEASAADEAKNRQQAWSLIRTYLEQTPIPKDELPLAVECRLEADLSKQGLTTIVGVIDLVRAGGRIVDYKTSATTPAVERVEHLHETQLSIYALLYREATGETETALELHHLVKLKQPKLVVSEFSPITDAQQTRLFRLIESYLNGLDREDFVPAPGLQCAACPFFQECRAWH